MLNEDRNLDDVQLTIKNLSLKQYTDMSIKYQVLSRATAFILVSDDKI